MEEKDNSQAMEIEKKGLSTSTQVAAGLSAVWAIIVIAVVALKWPDVKSMKLNELGDFLPGTMSPLAFLWLIAGYRQQGEELKQNTEALLLQRRELKELVEANNKIAVHAEQQANASISLVELEKGDRAYAKLRAIQKSNPDFHLKVNDFSHEHYMCELTNEGGLVTNITIKLGVSKKVRQSAGRLANHGKLEFTVHAETVISEGLIIEYTIKNVTKTELFECTNTGAFVKCNS